jgi:hypothetical protein
MLGPCGEGYGVSLGAFDPSQCEAIALIALCKWTLCLSCQLLFLTLPPSYLLFADFTPT